MGCGGEGGEVCDAVKKLHRDGDYSDTSKVAGELCDALTYVLMLGRTIGIDWERSIAAMVGKCEARWGVVTLT